MEIKKIAIQGGRGSFHELAANKFFQEKHDYVLCETFKSLFDNLKKENNNYGVVAIENTVAGTILPNYAMLRNSEMQIIGEVYLRIQQNLMALPGQKIKNLKEVHSHPMAILQCHDFFEKHPNIKLIESFDTALSAKWIAESQIKNIGALAGTNAASLYGLEILAESIETNKKNFTRFLVIQNKQLVNNNGKADKASVCFNVPHVKGSLAKVLSILAKHNINLTKIQSLPLLGKEWEYYIHIDLEFDDYNSYKKVMQTIHNSVTEFKILGEYKRGEKL